MEGFYKRIPKHPRTVSLAVLVLATIAAALFRSPFWAITGWASAVIIYTTVKDPGSWIALQQDARDAEEIEVYNKFIDILVNGKIIDSKSKDEGVQIDSPAPYVFEVKMEQVGKNVFKLRKAIEGSLDYMRCVSFECSQIKPGEFLVTFAPKTPIQALGELWCPYNDMLVDEEPITISNLPVGKDVDGSVVKISLESRNALLAGVMGSGKSAMLSAIICGLLRISNPGEERTVIISPKILDFQNFAGACELIKEYKDILAFLDSLREEVERRKNFCIQHGIKKIEPEHYSSCPHITVIVDEYAVIKSAPMPYENGKGIKVGEQIEAQIMSLIAEARFASVSFVIALQKADSRNIDTRIRDLISGVRCSFAAEGRTSTEMVFGDYASEAPCHEIGVDTPGVGYIQVDSAHPKLFKCAYAGNQDEIAAAEHFKEKRAEYFKENNDEV